MASTATFAQIRAGLVANLRTLGIQSTGYVLSEPMAPSIECYPSEVAYDQAFGRGLDSIGFIVRITVALTLDVAGQKTLDEYLAPSGAKSVKTLLESDKTLGGVVQYLHVTGASGYEQIEKLGGLAISATWTVAITA